MVGLPGMDDEVPVTREEFEALLERVDALEAERAEQASNRPHPQYHPNFVSDEIRAIGYVEQRR